jgi:hypothetical protein
VVIKDAVVSYSIPQPALSLSLSAKGEEGNFIVVAGAKVLDCNSNSLLGPGQTQPLGLDTEETISDQVFFEGESVVIGGTFSEDFQGCAISLRDAMDQAAQNVANVTLTTTPPLIWLPIDMPAPELVWQNIQDTRTAVASLPSESISFDTVLQQTAVAHGSAYVRAVLARASGLTKAVVASSSVSRVRYEDSLRRDLVDKPTAS